MAKLGPQSGYSRLQELFLLRSARLGALAHQYAQHIDAPAEYATLITWALRSTLADCAQLEVYGEAVALALGRED
jgi:hypothetical protein